MSAFVRLVFRVTLAALTIETNVSWAQSGAPTSKPSHSASTGSESQAEGSVEWPTFEPFEFARSIHERSIDANSGAFDPTASVKQLRELTQALKKIASRSRSIAAEVERKMAWSHVPIFMIELGALSQDLDWDATELELAAMATTHFKSLKDGVDVDLSVPESRREGLDAIATWFKTQVKDPTRYGEMILSFDQGPYMGIAVEVPENVKLVGEFRVREGLELKLFDVEGSDRRLVAYREGKVIWARTLTHFGSRDALNSVKFLGGSPQSLGSYGLRIAMTYGENLSLYLDPEGNFLFYLQSI